MSTTAVPIHVGTPTDAPWCELPEGTEIVSFRWNEGPVGLADATASSIAAVIARADVTDTDAFGAEAFDADRDADVNALRRLRERFPDVPILVYTSRDDPDMAIDAGRLGMEYVSGRRLEDDGETLADRIGRDHTLRTAGAASGSTGVDRPTGEKRGTEAESNGFLESFVRITSDRRTDVEGKLDSLLALGRDHLDVSIGFASRTGEERFELIRQQGADELLRTLSESGTVADDGTLPMATTYCRRTVDDGGIVALSEASTEGWSDDPAYETLGLETYIGGRVVVENDVLGTLCFADESPRDESFTEDERLFVELLADWLGHEFERRHAREGRKEALDRLERTLERIDDGFFALDTDWTFTYVNGAAAKLLDRTREALVGTNVWEEFPDALGRRYESKYREAMDTQEVVSFEEYYEPLDLWTEVTAYPSDGGLSVFFRDVTDRKRREETLAGLLRTTERLQLADDKRRVADRLVDAASDILGQAINGVRLHDPDSGRLELAAMSDELADRFGSRPPRDPGDGVVGRAFDSGRPQVSDDLQALDDDRDYRGVRSVVAVPLGDHGVITVGSTEPDAFDESDVSVVKLLATNAAAAMDRIDRQRRLQTYERVLENVDDMVCVLEDGTVTYATRPFASWLGVDRIDLVGRPLVERLPDVAASTVADALDGLAPSASATCELRIASADGPDRRGNLQLSPLVGRDGHVVGSITDTTELNRTRAELVQERERFSRLFEELPDPVMEVDHRADETVISAVNEAFEDQFGYDAEELHGRSIDVLDLQYERTAANVADVTSLARRIREEGSITDEVRRRTVNGPREFLFRGFKYDTRDGPRAFGIYTDITERKNRERYLKVVNRILRHNLRNELNVIFGFAGEISRVAEDDRVADYADRVDSTARQLADLAEGAAEFKRVVDGGPASELESVPVAPIVERVVENRRNQRSSADWDVQFDVDVPESLAIRGDGRFESVIDHLVENAVVHAVTDAPRVEIGAEAGDGIVTVTVADDGSGIPESIREVVTGEREITQLRHNSGIGLWIVTWVIDAYGGDVTFGPGIDGDGTTVTLRIPAAE